MRGWRLAKRLRRGRRAKAAKCGYAGGNAPIGYKRERHTKKLVIDPEMAEVVKHVFRIRKKHRHMTLDEIAALLHEAGYVTSTGRKYHRAQIKRILDNRDFYAGNMLMTVSLAWTANMRLLKAYKSWYKRWVDLSASVAKYRRLRK